MHNWNLFLANVVSPGKVASYLNTEGVLTSGTMDEKLEQIHTQFWVALYPDEYEIYANYRRTGYPVLIPLNAAGNVTNGTIPRRLIYPASEEGNNSDNYSAAISKIPGGNVFTGRVWWDKP
jgi:hypothetical protein